MLFFFLGKNKLGKLLLLIKELNMVQCYLEVFAKKNYDSVVQIFLLLRPFVEVVDYRVVLNLKFNNFFSFVN